MRAYAPNRIPSLAPNRAGAGLPRRRLARMLDAVMLAGGLAGALAAAPASAQLLPPPKIVFPAGSLMGYASFTSGPTLTVNCVNYPVGPGLRVQTPQQRVLLSGQLPGLSGPAVFQRDSMGNVFRVWLLDRAQALPPVGLAPNRCLFRQD